MDNRDKERNSYFTLIIHDMTAFESIICQMAEEKTSGEIEALIAELQMIAETKYAQEETRNNYELPGFSKNMAQLHKLSIFA